MIVKRILGKLWAGWKRFAHIVGVVNRYVFLTVFYFVCVCLVNLGLRIARVDLLDRRQVPATTYWRPKDRRIGEYHHQF